MFFSIIIPIYNVRKHIQRGFESLLSQTFKDFEVILVDDGSTDGSGDECQRLALAYDFVRLYKQPNSGSGPARNLGIEKARGEYLVFFDIDDIIHPNALEVIRNALSKSSPDILMFGYREIDDITKKETNLQFRSAEYRSNAEIRDAYVKEISSLRFNNGFVWNKVYNRRFVNHHKFRFEELRIQQDEVFNLSIFPHASTMIVLNDILYDYYVYHSGNTRSHYIPERISIYTRVRKSFETLISEWPLCDSKFTNYVHHRYLCSVIDNINLNLFGYHNDLSFFEKIGELKSLMSDQYIVSAVTDMTITDDKWVIRYANALKANSVKKYLLTLLVHRAISYIKAKLRKFT